VDSDISNTEVTRFIKRALRVFPDTAFAVKTRHRYVDLEWPDGPEITAVCNALVTAGAQEQEPAGGRRNLRVHDRRVEFWRYDAAERAAGDQAFARQRAVEDARAARINAALAAVEQSKREAIAALRFNAPAFDTSQLAAANQAFETLRTRAEVAVAIEQDRQRRPSWAPPLILEGELLELCRALKYLAPEDPPIARLWATFADPKKSRTYLRERFSSLALTGIECRGFQLFAGSERGNTSGLLFEAQRTEAGEWRFGPDFYWRHYASPYRYDWERLTRQRLTAEDRVGQGQAFPTDQAEIERLTQLIAAIDAADLGNAGRQRVHSEQKTRALELAQQRVLEFVGAPAQMQLAARLCGHCCICFKALTDPVSLERGIGPECLQKRVDFIKDNEHEPVEWLAFNTSMPVEFVREILNEGTVHDATS
jgi:hypothetical protein